MTEFAPKTFYLNEQHELTRNELSGGGGLPKLAPIDWKTRQAIIGNSLARVEQALTNSIDPVRAHRFYFLAQPEAHLVKKSDSKSRKLSSDGTYEEAVEYAGLHSRMFNRLGVDIVHVNEGGDAVVHVSTAGFQRLRQLSLDLEGLGKLDQSRWATIKHFEVVPYTERVDEEWLDSLQEGTKVEIVFELQPLLRRGEAQEVLSAISKLMPRRPGEGLSGYGTDYSGRQWARGYSRLRSIEQIASNFFSVQSIHPPIRTPLSMAKTKRSSRSMSAPKTAGAVKHVPEISTLPVVAVVDGGVPPDHEQLGPYRRATIVNPDMPGWLGPHGSYVASRVVFGDLAIDEAMQGTSPGGFRFLDVQVAGDDDRHIDSKAVVAALGTCVAAHPDVQVFNLSFGDPVPLAAQPPVLRREKLVLTQDLDNFAFANDVLIVVAAGNSVPGQVPNPPYPHHVDDPDWGLAHWACAFNTLTCGAFVAHPGQDGMVEMAGAPSPFCKVGPGLLGSAVPDVSAGGGDLGPNHKRVPHLGVSVVSHDGVWDGESGTSFAAPLASRECALALELLSTVCRPGTRPFAATAKAYLALTAKPPYSEPGLAPLVARTLGRGEVTARGLQHPAAESAVFVWQGKLSSAKDIVRVQVPVPAKWLKAAERPLIELSVAYETPVNAAVDHIYSSRFVGARLRPHADSRPLVAARDSRRVEGYPLYLLKYDLHKKRDMARGADMWVVELQYKQIGEYYAGLDFSGEQRVGLAVRLVDVGDSPTSPQSFVQALPVAVTMNRLSVVAAPVRTPVVVKIR